METTFTWAATPTGATTLTLRNRGTPSGYSRIAAPVLEQAMRRATTKDLTRLRSLLEQE